MRRYGVVIKLLAAAAVATASAPAAELPLAFCEDIEVIDTKVLTKIELAAPIGGRKIVDGLFLLPRPLPEP